MDRNKIIESNKSIKILENCGYSIQGCTKDFKKVGVSKDNKIHIFNDYVEARKALIPNL